jgi:hypothetical protein
LGSPPYDETYLQYCGSTTTVCSSRGEWFLLSWRWRMPITGNGSFTNYAPGLSIKTNNYILPYSLHYYYYWMIICEFFIITSNLIPYNISKFLVYEMWEP